jgi:ribosomal protein S27AE
MTMLLKACPRCGGDLMADPWDETGKTMTCIQCGRSFRTAPVTANRQPVMAQLATLKKAS